MLNFSLSLSKVRTEMNSGEGLSELLCVSETTHLCLEHSLAFSPSFCYDFHCASHPWSREISVERETHTHIIYIEREREIVREIKTPNQLLREGERDPINYYTWKPIPSV